VVVLFVALVILVVLLVAVTFWSIDPLNIIAAAPTPTINIIIANTNIIKFSVFINILNPIYFYIVFIFTKKLF
jgi:hypothetical protein